MTKNATPWAVVTFLALLTVGIRVQAQETYGPLRPGESLWEIAREVYPDHRLTRYQVMLALWRENRQSFRTSCNLNSLLRAGATLQVPSLVQAKALNAAEARREVQRQAAEWKDHIRTGRPLVCPPLDKAGAAPAPSAASPPVQAPPPQVRAPAKAPPPIQAAAPPSHPITRLRAPAPARPAVLFPRPRPLDILLVVMLALSCNLDNLAIGISYGVRDIRLPFSSNLLIAVITAGGTLAVIISGRQVHTVVSSDVAVAIGSLILIAMGVWVIAKDLLSERASPMPVGAAVSLPDQGAPARNGFWYRLAHVLKDPSLADKDTSGHIDYKESLLLSLALMLNNIPNGLAAGMLRLPPLFTALVVGLLSIGTFSIGIGAGRKFGHRWLGAWAETVAGILLIALGLLEIFVA
jgi:putative sporulation protein YtaF